MTFYVGYRLGADLEWRELFHGDEAACSRFVQAYERLLRHAQTTIMPAGERFAHDPVGREQRVLERIKRKGTR